MLAGKSQLYDAAGSINIVTFLAFMFLYYVEIRRENKMIDYLEMNRELPKDNESVGEALVKLDKSKQDELHGLDHEYRYAGYVAMFMFVTNTGLSAVPILQHTLDAKTYTVLLTNVLFIASKLHEVYSIVNTKEHVFYSAYLTERQQFNDVDPDVLTPALAESEEDTLVSTENVTVEETKEEV
jgi:hypothetical protein